MLNSDNGAIMDEIINSVAIVYHWKDFYNPVFKKVVEVPDTILSSYVGEYMLNGETITIIEENDKLIFNFRNMLWTIYFTSNVDFFVMEFKANLNFIVDSEGKVNGFNLYGNTAKKVK